MKEPKGHCYFTMESAAISMGVLKCKFHINPTEKLLPTSSSRVSFLSETSLLVQWMEIHLWVLYNLTNNKRPVLLEKGSKIRRALYQ